MILVLILLWFIVAYIIQFNTEGKSDVAWKEALRVFLILPYLFVEFCKKISSKISIQKVKTWFSK